MTSFFFFFFLRASTIEAIGAYLTVTTQTYYYVKYHYTNREKAFLQICANLTFLLEVYWLVNQNYCLINRVKRPVLWNKISVVIHYIKSQQDSLAVNNIVAMSSVCDIVRVVVKIVLCVLLLFPCFPREGFLPTWEFIYIFPNGPF